MTLTEIQALAAEGGFPLAFTHHCVELAGAFVWLGPREIVTRPSFGSMPDTPVDFIALAEADFDPADGWFPLGGFW